MPKKEIAITKSFRRDFPQHQIFFKSERIIHCNLQRPGVCCVYDDFLDPEATDQLTAKVCYRACFGVG